MLLLVATVVAMAPPEVRGGVGADLVSGWGSDPTRRDGEDAALIQVAPWALAALRAETLSLTLDAAARVESTVPEATAPASERSEARGHAALSWGAPWLDLDLHGWGLRGVPADPGAPATERRQGGGFAARLRGAGAQWDAALGYRVSMESIALRTGAGPWGDASGLAHGASAAGGWRFGPHGWLGAVSELVVGRPEHPDPGEGREDLETLEARAEARLLLGAGWSARLWAGWWGALEDGGAGTGVGGAEFRADWGLVRLDLGGGRALVPSGWGGYAAENFGALACVVDSAQRPSWSPSGPPWRPGLGRVRFALSGRYAFVVHGGVSPPPEDADGVAAEDLGAGSVTRRRYMSHAVRNSERVLGDAELFVWLARGVAVGVSFRADVRLSRFRLQTVTETASGFVSAYAEDRYVDLSVLGGLRLELSSEDW